MIWKIAVIQAHKHGQLKKPCNNQHAGFACGSRSVRLISGQRKIFKACLKLADELSNRKTVVLVFNFTVCIFLSNHDLIRFWLKP